MGKTQSTYKEGYSSPKRPLRDAPEAAREDPLPRHLDGSLPSTVSLSFTSRCLGHLKPFPHSLPHLATMPCGCEGDHRPFDLPLRPARAPPPASRAAGRVGAQGRAFASPRCALGGEAARRVQSGATGEATRTRRRRGCWRDAGPVGPVPARPRPPPAARSAAACAPSREAPTSPLLATPLWAAARGSCARAGVEQCVPSSEVGPRCGSRQGARTPGGDTQVPCLKLRVPRAPPLRSAGQTVSAPPSPGPVSRERKGGVSAPPPPLPALPEGAGSRSWPWAPPSSCASRWVPGPSLGLGEEECSGTLHRPLSKRRMSVGQVGGGLTAASLPAPRGSPLLTAAPHSAGVSGPFRGS